MIILDKNKKVPLYEQLYREIKKSILSGELKKDEKLKPVRVMAAELKISHNTVDRAYMQLLSEGYVRSVQGSGFYVEELFSLQSVPSRKEISYTEDTYKIPKKELLKWDFRYDAYDSSQFPWNKWKKNVANAMLEESYADSIAYGSGKGSLKLRECICDYVYKTRRIICSPLQVIITPGFQYSMEIIMSVLPKAEYNVAIEEPAHNALWHFLKQKDLKITGIPVLESGIDANMLEKTDCNMLFTSPSHQFPTGISLQLVKRLQILEWSRRTHSYVIECDYDCEFTYKQETLLSMASLDRNDHVIYMNTFTNIMSPEIRCEYLILPEPLVPVYEEKFRYQNFPQPEYLQMALAEFIADGSLEAQARKMSALSDRKLKIIKEVLKRQPGDLMEAAKEAGGSYVLIRIRNFPDKVLLLHQLLSAGIRLYDPGNCWHFSQAQGNEFYLLGFGAIHEDKLEKAMTELADAVFDIKEKLIM